MYTHLIKFKLDKKSNLSLLFFFNRWIQFLFYQLKLGTNFKFESQRQIFIVENKFELIFDRASPSQTELNWVWLSSAQLVYIYTQYIYGKVEWNAAD